MRKVILIVLLALLATIPVYAQDSVIGGDEDALRRFLERQYMAMLPLDTAPTIYIEALPPDPWVDLPLPEDAELVGSQVIEGEFATVIIFADVTMTPLEVLSYYEANLGAAFTMAEISGMGGGFRSGTFPEDQDIYCYNDDEYLLIVGAASLEMGTAVRLTITRPAGMGTICDPSGSDTYRGGTLQLMLPTLASPPGARRVSSSGSSSGSRYAESNAAYVAEDMTTESFMTHFAIQLEDTGWELIEAAPSPILAWSLWTFTSDEGDTLNGRLIVSSDPNDDTRFEASIRISETN